MSGPLTNDAGAEEKWLALYVIVRHEKKVATQLKERRLEHYLPLYSTPHRWKDRRVVVTLPMFAGYLFVRCAPGERNRVLSIPGVVRFVSSNGAPITIPPDEFSRMRSVLEHHSAEPYPYLTAGKRVRLSGGALEGFEGRYIRRKGKLRAIVELDFLERAVILDIDAADLRE
jgi:transcription antitermination factor NusG